MSLDTASGKYRVCFLRDWIYFEEIPKCKAIGCDIKNCTQYSVTGEEYCD